VKHILRIVNAFAFYVVVISIIAVTVMGVILVFDFLDWFFTWRYLHQALWTMLGLIILYFTGWIGENL
jgi:hypothetical protein